MPHALRFRELPSRVDELTHLIQQLTVYDVVARPVEKRLVGRCHHFMLLLVAMLRSHGIPARARCGFGTYFNPPFFEDHWVCEYWNLQEARWVLVDAQFDDVWCAKLKINHDVRDVAALNKVELLPWDVWGAQPGPNEKLTGDQVEFFDRIAVLTRDPDVCAAARSTPVTTHRGEAA